MKFIHKKENRACPAKLERSGGFALLFSVLVSSLLLTIGLSIFNIALKELAISTATQRSIHAFYAADSGREYIRYKDLTQGDLIDFNPTETSLNYSPTSYTESDVLVDSSDSEGPNFSFTIKKFWHNDTYTKIDTTITSIGHDSTGEDRIERAIEQTY